MESEASAHRPRIVIAPRVHDRIAAADAWLDALAPGTEAIVVAQNQQATDDLVRAFAARRGALFGIHRMTFNRLIGLVAAEAMAARGLVAADGLALEAVAARTIYRLAQADELSYFEPVATRPGFPGALAATLGELRLNGIDPAALDVPEAREATVARLLATYAAELDAAGLADRAAIIELAIAAAAATPPPRFIGLPILLFDIAIRTSAERELVRALAARAPRIIATAPAGDHPTLTMLEEGFATIAEPAAHADTTAAQSSLERLQNHLFAETSPAESPLDESVIVRSAAGEMQECVEIARLIQAQAYLGVALDRIAVLLHAPGRYSPYLKEALDRAGLPAYFARGTSLPEPGGRALLALLACAAEGLSARRFAEYLSLAQLPYRNPQAPTTDDDDAEFVAPATELGPAALAADLELEPPQAEADPIERDPVPVVEGSLVAPWRWERLLVEAAVVGGRDRWLRRLGGLAAELELRRRELTDEDARAAALDRQLVDLAHLREYALPIVEALGALPGEATWSGWLGHLRTLTAIAIRDAETVLIALAELEPMGPIGPIGLDEVRLVMADRIGKLERPPSRRRYGAVFVAPTAQARGLEFEVVIVPGLTERVFPKKLTEDPILPDAVRARLQAPDPRAHPEYLPRQAERAAEERLALRLAAGAATRRAIFTFPRFDLAQGRPRVPSFYALEIMRAAEGRLPGFDELSRRATVDRSPRLGWPAPADPADAIDDAEFDLATLEAVLDKASGQGAAHYLLNANPHLARALRGRARRWLRRWTPADGLVDPSAGARAALQRHLFAARSYSPTALQNFAACPYRFFLQAIHRLQPRQEADSIEIIDPLTRGALFHEIQFAFLTELRNAGLIPVTATNHAAAQALLELTIRRVAEDYRDRLAPAIDRVWRDGIDSIGADLREWLRRMVDSREAWLPDRFELAFGLVDRAQADPASRGEPVELAGGLKLRGSIDLVERRAAGGLRVTDHKTGRVRAERGLIVGGGKVLQPILYALAAEQLLGAPVEAGRLYYCTAAGSYEERVVALDDAAREGIGQVIATVGRALEEGFLPALPATDECRFCDYRPVCGPYEEQRAARKPAARTADLRRMRELR
ncbi:MAG TPA: PD-(D/E)XK nuclease family protein [Candidatus Binataceae bacterium]|nr:PD-(D/E)XK nuclease family protein [Candidatus Binataceae bacterium]